MSNLIAKNETEQRLAEMLAPLITDNGFELICLRVMARKATTVQIHQLFLDWDCRRDWYQFCRGVSLANYGNGGLGLDGGFMPMCDFGTLYADSLLWSGRGGFFTALHLFSTGIRHQFGDIFVWRNIANPNFDWHDSDCGGGIIHPLAGAKSQRRLRFW